MLPCTDVLFDVQRALRYNTSVGDGSLIVLRSETEGKLAQLHLVGHGVKVKQDQRRLKQTYKPSNSLPVTVSL